MCRVWRTSEHHKRCYVVLCESFLNCCPAWGGERGSYLEEGRWTTSNITFMCSFSLQDIEHENVFNMLLCSQDPEKDSSSKDQPDQDQHLKQIQQSRCVEAVVNRSASCFRCTYLRWRQCKPLNHWVNMCTCCSSAWTLMQMNLLSLMRRTGPWPKRNFAGE